MSHTLIARQHTIRCAHCKGTHGSVAQVRACSALGSVPAQSARVADPFAAPVADDVSWAIERAGESGAYRRSDSTPAPSSIMRVMEEGMYQRGDNVYKVVRSPETGRLYSKKLVDGRFVYAPGALRYLQPSDKMSLEDAQKFGKLYGVCVRCGRTLTDETSIEAGIGPVCAKYF